ncbi:hypothetical protein O4H49_20385 [Kiloniella laminariae]|uniref:Uncharacterized protein n=1 Tax=Kiloniella laminariae TaxID=454162 RepID=A0ABT4LPT5_9PROT|nr:hypothetical protein [Kiloniella laminariae]MCZ4283148.1 hypothetical protein [Kiloniella laminariae]
MMAKSFRLEKNNSDDIGFASTCLVAGIIDFDEFKAWLYFVMENSDEIPSYFFNILDINEKFEYTLKRQEVVGFTPSWEGTTFEENALYGIGYKRNIAYQNDVVSQISALKALSKNPHIEERFKETFPFLELPE